METAKIVQSGVPSRDVRHIFILPLEVQLMRRSTNNVLLIALVHVETAPTHMGVEDVRVGTTWRDQT